MVATNSHFDTSAGPLPDCFVALGQPHSLTIYTTIKMSHDAQFENDYKGYVGKFKPKIVSSEKTHTLA